MGDSQATRSAVCSSRLIWARWTVLALGVVLGCWVVIRGGAAGGVREVLDWVRAQGGWAPVVFVGAYVLACVLMVPGSALTLGAGAVFGAMWGAIWVSIGSTLGAFASFLIGRFLARGWVEARLRDHPRFETLDAAVGREGWKVVGLLRLSPVFPFNLLNYSLGLTRVSWKEYLVASWLGMMPGTLLYTYLGSALGMAVVSGSPAAGPRGDTTGERVLFAVGLVATVVVTWWVTRLARRALDARLGRTP